MRLVKEKRKRTKLVVLRLDSDKTWITFVTYLYGTSIAMIPLCIGNELHLFLCKSRNGCATCNVRHYAKDQTFPLQTYRKGSNCHNKRADHN